MSSPSRDDEQSRFLDLCRAANAMLSSQGRVTEEGVDAIIEQLKVYSSSKSNDHAWLCSPLATVLRVRSLLPDIFLNPPLIGFSAEGSEVLGEGRAGAVYKTQYQDTDVAVKVLKLEERSITSDDVRSFFQEVQWWKEVSKSSHAAPFHGCSVSVNQNPSLVFTIVSPLANGGTLRKYDIDQNPHRVTWKHIIDIAKGLRDLHELGYLHGDLHIDNVLVFNGVAKLADFGVVKLANTVSAFTLNKQHVHFHPGWVDSEVMEGRPRSPRSDIFSYGRLICQLFDPEVFKDRVRVDDPPKPKKMEDASWNGLWETLLPCWQPGARPTADDIVSRLNNIVKQLVTSGENKS